MERLKAWIEAARPRTLPVSVAGVVAASAYALLAGCFVGWVAAAALVFAVLAQTASNFANEYFDYRAGFDRPGREGPRRGVTEGDLTPRSMLVATIVTLGLAAATGLTMVARGGWWLLPAGCMIVIAALAYSAGPWPLSRHGLGEVAVVFFFGVIPVNLTFYVMTLGWSGTVALGSVALGLMGANVLIVNNYRDRLDDLLVGKCTLAVRIGLRATSRLYAFNGCAAMALSVPTWALLPLWTWAIPAAYLAVHTALYWQLTSRHGRRLNPLLGRTALLMAGYSAALLAVAAVYVL